MSLRWAEGHSGSALVLELEPGRLVLAGGAEAAERPPEPLATTAEVRLRSSTTNTPKECAAGEDAAFAQAADREMAWAAWVAPARDTARHRPAIAASSAWAAQARAGSPQPLRQGSQAG